METYIANSLAGQASFNHRVNDPPPAPADLLDQYRTSPRSGPRVSDTITIIEREFADADRGASSAPLPCGGTAPPADAPPPANQSPVSNPAMGQAPAEHAVRAWQLGKRILHRLRLKKTTESFPETAAPRPETDTSQAPVAGSLCSLA